MSDWLYHLPVFWMALVVSAVVAVVTAATYAAVFALAVGKRAQTFKSISPVMLTPLSVVFGLIVGFLAAQVWNDHARANDAVTREAIALRTMAILARSFPDEIQSRIRALVRRHIDNAVNQEWPAMARQKTAEAMDSGAAGEALRVIVSIVPQNEAQALIQRELLSALRAASDARRERIVLSLSTINWLKWTVVAVLSILILVTIAIVHSDNRAAAAIAMSIFSIGVAACVVLVAAHNRPFTGEISVGPQLLIQERPKE